MTKSPQDFSLGSLGVSVLSHSSLAIQSWDSVTSCRVETLTCRNQAHGLCFQGSLKVVL